MSFNVSRTSLAIWWTLLVAVQCQPDNCFKLFGCFPNTEEFQHPIFRPVNVPPEPPAKINITFYLYGKWLDPDDCPLSETLPDDVHYRPCVFLTRHLYDIGQLRARLRSLAGKAERKEVDFDGKWTGVLVHGFLDGIRDSTWMSVIKNKLLDNQLRPYHSVVLVDWSGGNGIPYLQATANSRLVGAQIAYFIQLFSEYFQVKPDQQLHMIGHSIGSHITGYVSDRLPTKPARITVLDPAAPNFEGMPESIRIDPSDAHLVDAIHTNGKPLLLLGYGMSELVGHVDFYPNGGADQPGCETISLPSVLERLVFNPQMFTDWSDLFVCSHLRAIDYFVESIPTATSQCQFEAVGCDSWTDYLNGSCLLNQRIPMGFEVNIAQLNQTEYRKFFLKTNSKFPFCQNEFTLE